MADQVNHREQRNRNLRRRDAFHNLIENELYLQRISEIDEIENGTERDDINLSDQHCVIIENEQQNRNHGNHETNNENEFEFELTSSLSETDSTILANPSINPDINSFIDATMASLFSFCNLNVSETELVVNLINSLNERYSNDPIKLPNARHFWRKATNSTLLEVFILCNQYHSHGPYTGEPSKYEPFLCENRLYPAELKPGRYFIHLPVRQQLQEHLPAISDDFWFNERVNDGEVSDISNAFQAMKIKSQIASSYGNYNNSQFTRKFTLTLLSDEIGPFKGSKIKIFPIYLSLNELSPPSRRDHYILAGLFVGQSKPLCEVFLDTVCFDLKSLETEPITWTSKESGITTSATFHLIGLVADAPMRAFLRTVGQFNHTFGCDWCLIESLRGKPGARIYPPVRKEVLCRLKRTKNDFIEFKRIYDLGNLPEGERFKGIHRPSPLIKLNAFDIVSGVSVDTMHCISLGIIRNIVLKAWNTPGIIFESRTDCNKFLQEVSNRLIKIKVPSCFTRVTRTIEEAKLWKSNEYDAFLCYYLLSTVKGLLRNKHAFHLSILAKIYSVSHRGAISEEKIGEIENLIHVFQRATVDLYGSDFLTYNHHILAHIPDSIRNLGPTSNVSAYPLEDHMGMLKKKVNRFSKIPQALVRVFLNRFKYIEGLSSNVRRWNLTEKEKEAFGVSITNHPRERSNNFHGMKFIGVQETVANFSQLAVDWMNSTTISQQRIETNDITIYSSIKYKGLRVSSSDYCEKKERDDSSFATNDGNCYKVHFLFSTPHGHFVAAYRYSLRPIQIQFEHNQDRVEFHVEYTYNIVSKDSRLSMISIDDINRIVLVIPAKKFHNSWKFDHLVDPFLMNI